jgi:hypothetical protein
LAESIRTINECYPEEIVRYYSPGYSNTLLSKLDAYTSAGQSSGHCRGGSFEGLDKRADDKDEAGNTA